MGDMLSKLGTVAAITGTVASLLTILQHFGVTSSELGSVAGNVVEQIAMNIGIGVSVAIICFPFTDWLPKLMELIAANIRKR